MDFILLAGGVGKRMKKSIPKQLLLIGGKPIIMHTLERIDTIKEVDSVIITTPEEYVEQLESLVKRHKLKKKVLVVAGGESRQDSVLKGLEHVTTDQVVIHEAVRPFIRKKEFVDLIKNGNENVTLGLDIPFTVLEGKEKVEKVLERASLFNVQLPQKFNAKKLLKAHLSAKKEGKVFTEDASLYFHYQKEDVHIVHGTEYNIKITKPIDLVIGEIIYRDYILGREA